MQSVGDEFGYLLAHQTKRWINTWLEEDCPSFDYGGFVVGNKEETALLYCKESCILAGIPAIEEIFTVFHFSFQWAVHEGESVTVPAGEKVRAL
jgi:nicotinate-nucleotide pyrophosphorylase (carboxylating)